jgi:hypothetical protein
MSVCLTVLLICLDCTFIACPSVCCESLLAAGESLVVYSILWTKPTTTSSAFGFCKKVQLIYFRYIFEVGRRRRFGSGTICELPIKKYKKHPIRHFYSISVVRIEHNCLLTILVNCLVYTLPHPSTRTPCNMESEANRLLFYSQSILNLTRVAFS